MNIRRLLEAGYTHVLPVIPPGAQLSAHSSLTSDKLGYTPGKWTASGWVGLGGRRDTQALTPEELAAAEWHGAGAGLLAFAHPAVDCDVKAPEVASAIREALAPWIGTAPERVGATPKWLRWGRLKGEPFAKRTLGFEYGGTSHLVEFLASGQYFNVFAAHPKLGTPYIVTGDIAADRLPEIDEAARDAMYERVRKLLTERFLVNLDRSRAQAGGVTITDEGMIPEHARNDSLYRIISGLRRRYGLNERALLDAARAINAQACRPEPLEDREVRALVKSAMRAEPRSSVEDPGPPGALLNGKHVLDIVTDNDVAMRNVEWVAPDLVARREAAVLAGEGGDGKSQITGAFAANLSRGVGLIDGAANAMQASTLILSSEDREDTTMVPRYRAAGGRPGALRIVRGRHDVVRPRLFDMERDLDALHAEARAMGDVGLIIIDPVTAYMSSKLDSHKTTDVRGWLLPIQQVLDDLDAAGLLVGHFNKNVSTARFMHRVSGSAAWTQAVRLALVAGHRPDSDERVLVRVKNNLGARDRDGYLYRIEGMTVEGVSTSRVRWGEAIEGSAEQLLGAPKREKLTGEQIARAWLQTQLQGKGAVPVSVLRQAWEELDSGIGWKTVQRAREGLGAIAVQVDKHEWVWKMVDGSEQNQRVKSARPSLF